MKDDDVPRAFDLFFTTKEPGHGTGLGLATAHKILTDHGGRIELRSRGAEGLDVEFVLPRFRG
jgi:signal transduction histidine kinase